MRTRRKRRNRRIEPDSDRKAVKSPVPPLGPSSAVAVFARPGERVASRRREVTAERPTHVTHDLRFIADVGDVDDGSAGFVAGGEVDEGEDAPVVVIGGVVEDLADRPAAGVVDRMLVDQE